MECSGHKSFYQSGIRRLTSFSLTSCLGAFLVLQATLKKLNSGLQFSVNNEEKRDNKKPWR